MKSATFTLFLLFPVLLLAQNDSQEALNSAKGNKRAELLESLSRKMENSDVSKAIIYAKEALTLAENRNDSISIERLSGLLGQLNRLQTSYDSSKIYYEQALALAKLRHASANAAEYLNGLGLLYRQKGDLTQAITISLEALRSAESVHDAKQTGNAYFNIGYIFNILDSYDSSLLFHKKSMAIRKASGDSIGVAGSYNGIGLVFMKNENYSEARRLYMQAALMIDEEENPRLLSMIYNNIGVTYENQGNYKLGRDYYFKSLELKKKMNDKRGMASTYGNLGDNYRESGNADECIQYARLSMKLCLETKSLDYLITAHKLLSFGYELKGDFKQALEEYRTFKELQDSLYNENKSRQISELLTKHSMEKKEKENVMLKAAASASEFKLTRQKIVILAIMACLCAVLFVLSFLYRMYMKSRELVGALALQKAEADASNHRLQEVLLENDNMTHIMVHDLRSPMNQVLGLTELMQKEGTLNEHQSVYVTMMNQAVKMGRRVVDDLLSISKRESLTIESFMMDDFLKDFVDQYISGAAKKDIQLQLKLKENNVLLYADKEVLRRILDNLLGNAIKFSPPGKKIIMKLENESEYISVYIIDEGPGFSDEDKKRIYQKFMRLSARPTGGEPSTGLGLAIVKHLTEQLKGKISLTSAPGAGATFKVSLPVNPGK